MLGIAGDWQPPCTAPQAETALPAWLAGGISGAAAEAAAGSGSGDAPVEAGAGTDAAGLAADSWVHRDCLAAAEALAEELERCRVLHRLLRPSAAAAGAAGEKAAAADAADDGLAGLDCTGWRLVLSGHGLGAGAAALLALRLQAWQLGERHLRVRAWWAAGAPCCRLPAPTCRPGRTPLRPG